MKVLKVLSNEVPEGVNFRNKLTVSVLTTDEKFTEVCVLVFVNVPTHTDCDVTLRL